MFPGGDLGLSPDIQQSGSNKKVSLFQYLQYRLQVRTDEDFILRFRRLTHYYVVDGYCRVEPQRLRFIATKNRAKQIRCELYSGVINALNSAL